MKENSGNTDRMIEEVVRIAHALDGQQESDFDKTGDRLRDAIGRIANQVEHGGGGGGTPLPSRTSDQNGMFLHVNSNSGALEWSDTKGVTLPIVTVLLHYSYSSQTGSIWWYTLKGSNTALTFDELGGIIDEHAAGRINLIIENEYDYRKESEFVSVAYSKGGQHGPTISYSFKKEVNRSFHTITWFKDTDTFTDVTLNTYSKPHAGIPESDFEQAVKDKLNRFVVTLTPTSADYSGTMDKTVSEINAAYNAGRDIWFDFQAQGKSISVPCRVASSNGTDEYMSFDCSVVDLNNNLMVYAWTGYTNDGTKATYSAVVYTLTRAS